MKKDFLCFRNSIQMLDFSGSALEIMQLSI